MPGKYPTTFRIRTKADLETLIRDFREAFNKSRRTGGGHCVFRKAPDGSFPIAAEFQVQGKVGYR